MDTKCLIGYNDDTVVIAFRGTASMANVYSDLKVLMGWVWGVRDYVIISIIIT